MIARTTTLAALAAVSLATVPAVAATPEFMAGTRAALAGDPHAAATAFERDLAHGWSAATLFDLGNAYASAGELGRAILSYERAHLLAPDDPAIATNLAHVRDEAAVGVAPPSSLDRALARLTADEWTWLAIAAGVLACAGLVALGWRFHRRAARTAILVGAVATAVCGAAAARALPSRDRAVVLARSDARIAPADSADAVFTARPGEIVQIEKRHGDRVYVRDGDRRGWLPRSSVERVIPD